MNRLFLTLLALLTGFVAQVSPGQAAVRDAGEIGAVQVARGAACLTHQVAARATVAQRVERLAAASEPAALRAFALVRPGTLIRIDRAHE